MKTLINPSELYDGSSFGMSQAVVLEKHGLVFVSGQVDWNRDFQITETSFEGQLKSALRNLEIVLREANASVKGLLQVRIFVRGELADYMEMAAPILAAFLGESRPAVTGVGVASLADRELLVEVEAIAIRDPALA
ncbi:RidA family protein [Pelagicoccus sp. SDUM812003]|uniref:RidA family protein n=1 Tax=Pelagicoccus sp. SDUM812003 TaxID=3041267 RepID=UPI00280F89BD|nr:RidA family protein [Pelagicoccus sp. SDUM812003]MDQ8202433.1 RidA family protein [Pelagicoccus sp. SDUM812003]